MRDQDNGAIEYFLWKHSDNREDKLIYYDHKGTYYEKTVDRAMIDRALKVFDGRPRAVHRSNGGLITVEPYQLVLMGGEKDQAPHVRVRVKFKDLKYDESRRVISNQTVEYTKTVLPEELVEPFPFLYQGNQSFVMNFGQGLVPVYLFHLDEDAAGNATAFFIEYRDLDRALHCPSGEKALVQAYSLSRDVIRLASDKPDAEGLSEYDRARLNYDRLVASGANPIPECFKTGDPIQVPAGGTMQDVRHYLRILMQRQRGGAGLWEPIYISIQREDSGELMPFGALEG
jgi:hypothetical protein